MLKYIINIQLTLLFTSFLIYSITILPEYQAKGIKVNHLLITLFVFTIFIFSCTNPSSSLDIINDDQELITLINANHPKADKYQTLLDNFVKRGIPGAILLIETPDNGLWAGASGKSNLHQKTPMKLGNILNIASVTKLFTAISTIKILNQKEIDLNSPVKNYLPEYCNDISNANKATFKQLLNHTSGIFNFTENINWYLDILNNISIKMDLKTQLEYAYNIESYGDTASIHKYSNTGYLFLGLALDSILGYDHHSYFKDSIFTPLGMNSALYEEECFIPKGIVSSYVDFHGDGILTDASTCSFGFGFAEGGIVCSIYDLYLFSKALFKEDLLTDTLYNIFTNCIDTQSDKKISQSYGLGIEMLSSKYGKILGHPGQNIGYSCYLAYFPEKDVTVILMTNVGASGKPHKIITDFILTAESESDESELYNAIFQ